MQKNYTLYIFIVSVCLLGFTNLSTAQSSIYTQNFDSAYALPNGWYAANSWNIDSTNSSTGYTGASGLNNVAIQNQSARAGYDTLFSNSISTIGYANIAVIWAARNTTHFSDSGSAITGFYWSADNGNTWNDAAYTENGNNSTWSLDNNGTFINLPAGASNRASVQFAWVAKIVVAPSGTYRIDDFNVLGTSTTGIETVSDNKVYVYCNNSSVINIISRNTLTEKLNVNVYDVTGNEVCKTIMNAQSIAIDASTLSSGIYFVQVCNQSQNSVSKVFIK
jgi:Secretion system C-terminal sorting domain